MSRKQSRAQSEEAKNENERLKSELMSKSVALDKTKTEFDQMKQKYDDLVRLACVHEYNSSSGSECGSYCKSSQTIELQQWNQMWTRCVAMATQVISLPSAPAATEAEKRSVLTDIVSRLCDKVKHPEQMDQFHELKKKYSRSKKNLFHLNQRCMQLMDTVRRNARIIKEYIQEVDTKENESFSKKLDELGEILKEQLRQEDVLIKESKQRKGKLVNAMNSMKKTYVESESDGSDDTSFESIVIKPKKKVKKTTRKETKKTVYHQELSTESSNDEETPRIKKFSHKHSRVEIENSSESDENRKQKKHKTNLTKREINDLYESSYTSSEDDDEIASKSYKGNYNKSKMKRQHLEMEKKFVENSSDSEPIPKVHHSYKQSSHSIIPSSDESDSDVPNISKTSRRQFIKSINAEFNDDVVTIPPKQKNCCSKCKKVSSLRGVYGNHVNSLIRVTNKFGNDYKRMKYELDSDDEIGSHEISKISYIDDSVVKHKKKVTYSSSD